MDLYEKYHFEEPWDGEHNRELLKQTPDVFRSPLDVKSSTNASYFPVVMANPEKGKPRTLFAGSEGTKLADVRDEPSQTIALTEAKREIPWTKPEDIPIAGGELQPDRGGWYSGVFYAVMADGTTTAKLPVDVESQRFRKLILINDGEVVDRPEISGITVLLSRQRRRLPNHKRFKPREGEAPAAPVEGDLFFASWRLCVRFFHLSAQGGGGGLTPSSKGAKVGSDVRLR